MGCRERRQIGIPAHKETAMMEYTMREHWAVRLGLVKRQNPGKVGHLYGFPFPGYVGKKINGQQFEKDHPPAEEWGWDYTPIMYVIYIAVALPLSVAIVYSVLWLIDRLL